MRSAALLVVLPLVAAACSSSGDDAATTSVAASPATTDSTTAATVESEGALIPPATSASLRNQLGFEFPDPPEVPTGPPDDELVESLDELFGTLDTLIDLRALEQVGQSGDPRAAWLLSDLLRFLGPGGPRSLSLDGFELLTGASLVDDPVALRSEWQSVTDHLIARRPLEPEDSISTTVSSVTSTVSSIVSSP